MTPAGRLQSYIRRRVKETGGVCVYVAALDDGVGGEGVDGGHVSVSVSLLLICRYSIHRVVQALFAKKCR